MFVDRLPWAQPATALSQFLSKCVTMYRVADDEAGVCGVAFNLSKRDEQPGVLRTTTTVCGTKSKRAVVDRSFSSYWSFENQRSNAGARSNVANRCWGTKNWDET